ncbi:MAG: hypothetical protein NZ866_00270 [Patescibacteria group bacterium]|nr:hypothetical protein [Patescibacteria group bacterium]
MKIGYKKLKIFLGLAISSLFFLPNNLSSSQNVCQLDNALNYGYLESVVFDLGDEYQITKLKWQGEKTDKHFVGFQLASSLDYNGPWLFYGKSFFNDYIDHPPFKIYSFQSDNPHKNIRYFKYRVYLATCEEFSSPEVEKIILYYRK